MLCTGLRLSHRSELESRYTLGDNDLAFATSFEVSQRLRELQVGASWLGRMMGLTTKREAIFAWSNGLELFITTTTARFRLFDVGNWCPRTSNPRFISVHRDDALL